MKRRRRLRDRLALPAREFLAHRLDYLPLAWDHLHRLGDVLPSFAGFLDPAEARTYSRKSSLVMPLVAPLGSPVRSPVKNPMAFSPTLATSSPASSSPTSPATFSPSLPSTPAASALKLLLGSCLSFTSVVFTCFLVSSSTISSRNSTKASTGNLTSSFEKDASVKTPLRFRRAVISSFKSGLSTPNDSCLPSPLNLVFFNAATIASRKSPCCDVDRSCQFRIKLRTRAGGMLRARAMS